MEGHLAVRGYNAIGAKEFPGRQALGAVMVGQASRTLRTCGGLSVVSASFMAQHLSEKGLAVVLGPLAQRIVLPSKKKNQFLPQR
jgi:hypothetical protein